MRKRPLFLLIIGTVFCIGICFSAGYARNDSDKYDMQEVIIHANGTEYILKIPSTDKVREYGYPVNENGETFGQDIYEWEGREPDLQLVGTEERAIGYVRADELNDGPSNPKEVEEWIKNAPTESNIYLQDGITCVGKFPMFQGELVQSKE